MQPEPWLLLDSTWCALDNVARERRLQKDSSADSLVSSESPLKALLNHGSILDESVVVMKRR